VRAPRAVVFDLDGTLADTRVDIAAACNHVLISLGRRPRSVDDISGFVGDGARLLLARALDTSPTGPLLDGALARFHDYYPHHAADHAAWMPGAREALDACAALSLPLSLATNKPRNATLPLLDALGMGSRFRVIVAGGDGPLKPDPAAIRSALGPMGVEPHDAWVVGDGPQDIGAGKAAGAWTVAVLGGFASEERLRAERPDRVIASLHDLIELLRLLTPAQAQPTR